MQNSYSVHNEEFTNHIEYTMKNSEIILNTQRQFRSHNQYTKTNLEITNEEFRKCIEYTIKYS